MEETNAFWIAGFRHLEDRDQRFLMLAEDKAAAEAMRTDRIAEGWTLTVTDGGSDYGTLKGGWLGIVDGLQVEGP